MADTDSYPLADGPKTTDEQDALLDVIDNEQRPASMDHGKGDLARATARRAQAVRLRLSGASYDRIAEMCGYADKKSAWNAVNRALQQVETESVTQLRLLENARLDSDETVLRSILADPQTPPALKIRAVDSRLRLSARRSRLNGTDAPIQVALSAGVAADLADALTEAEETLSAFVSGEVLASRDDPPVDERQEA